MPGLGRQLGIWSPPCGVKCSNRRSESILATPKWVTPFPGELPCFGTRFSIGPGGSRGRQLRVVLILLGTAPDGGPVAARRVAGPAADGRSQIASGGGDQVGRGIAGGGRTEKALAAFSDAVRLRPEDARAYYSRACVYKRKGEPDKAAADLAQALRLHPGAGWPISTAAGPTAGAGTWTRPLRT